MFLSEFINSIKCLLAGQNITKQFESYIISRNPQSTYEVERYTKEYMQQLIKG